jgi:hypothetical protein
VTGPRTLGRDHQMGNPRPFYPPATLPRFARPAKGPTPGCAAGTALPRAAPRMSVVVGQRIALEFHLKSMSTPCRKGCACRRLRSVDATSDLASPRTILRFAEAGSGVISGESAWFSRSRRRGRRDRLTAVFNAELLHDGRDVRAYPRSVSEVLPGTCDRCQEGVFAVLLTH